MKKMGPVTKKWIAVRLEWVKKNPPIEDLWYCYYCNAPLAINPELLDMGVMRLTLDHKQARVRHPELRYALDNLVPACIKCNSDKGSLSDVEYKENLYT